MSDTCTIRPPIGLIVEGHSEHTAYPGFISQITGRHIYTPIENTRGNGGILRGLEEHLDDLTSTYHPTFIIVTLDLRDVQKTKEFATCRDLNLHLRERISKWVIDRKGNQIYIPLPHDIDIVIQIQSFETWLVADVDGLKKSGMFVIEEDMIWGDVDEDVKNPCKWLEEHRAHVFDIKNPVNIKKLVTNLAIDNMKIRSRSFRKFCKEVETKYQTWEKSLIQNSRLVTEDYK